MTFTARQNRLQQFFSGYFHEDWDAEADDWTGIVDEFAARASPTKRAQLAEDIEWLATQNEAGQLLFNVFGCYYDPHADGLAVLEWLSGLADRLTANTGLGSDGKRPRPDE